MKSKSLKLPSFTAKNHIKQDVYINNNSRKKKAELLKRIPPLKS